MKYVVVKTLGIYNSSLNIILRNFVREFTYRGLVPAPIPRGLEKCFFFPLP